MQWCQFLGQPERAALFYHATLVCSIVVSHLLGGRSFVRDGAERPSRRTHADLHVLCDNIAKSRDNALVSRM